MTERILCVDDDPNILQAYQRALRKRFQIEIAMSGAEALAAVEQQGPYAVVVADMRMPGMDGVELLAQVKQQSRDTVRMMLTGNADQQTALEAVNRGQIFRFLTKPCAPEDLACALEAGIAQYRLITAERELLSKTLGSCVKVLTDVLSLVSPTAFGRVSRVRRLIHEMCRTLPMEDVWQIEIAAMLSQVGCVVVPEITLAKAYHGEELSRAESEAFLAHPRVGRDLIHGIPRLEQVAEIIGHQETPYDNESKVRGQALPLGSRMLKVAIDFDTLVSAGMDNEMALAVMADRKGVYDPEMIQALQALLEIEEVRVIRRLGQVSNLVDGLTLAGDVRSLQGTLLCARGQEVTASMRARLRNYVANVGVQMPIQVFVPLDMIRDGVLASDSYSG